MKKSDKREDILKVTLRIVKRSDWDFILMLRNNKKYQKYFYKQGTISKESHYQYLKNQIKNPNFYNWIICNQEKDIGYVRILENDISIMLDDKFTLKGIGTKALEQVEKKAKELGLKKLVGRVMIDNESSKKIFVKNNYKLLMYWYEKKI